MDATLLEILLGRARALGMTAGQVKKACWKHGHHKRLEDLSDEAATDLAGKMKKLIAKKEKASVTMAHGQLIKTKHVNGDNGDGESHFVMNPMTGEEINIDNVDQLIEASLQAKHFLSKLRDFDQFLRKQALDLAHGEGKSRYLKGKKHSAILENCGGVYPDKMLLLQAFLTFPEFRGQFLRVERIALKLQEFNQMKNMLTDEPLYKEFTDLIRRAVEKGTPVLPVVKMDS